MNAQSANKLFAYFRGDGAVKGIKAFAEGKGARIHKTSQVKYPSARPIPLPGNVEAIITNEIGRFSPQRARDINGPVMVSQATHKLAPVFQITQIKDSYEPRVASFDCNGAVSLNSSMQSMVPCPFSSKGKSTHLNMPGGQWEKENKFIAEDMQKSHYINYLLKKKQGTRAFHSLTTATTHDSCSHAIILTTRQESTNKSCNPEGGGVKINESEVKTLSRKERLKKAVTEYGATVIVFHVGISLISLGTCYVLVSSGLDVNQLLLPLGLGGGEMSNKYAANAGTFVAAYAIHKVFAPVRISITLGATPFIVRYLRNIGFLKKPKV